MQPHNAERDNLVLLAQYYINIFFSDKLVNGYSIPFEVLNQDKYVDLVLDTCISESPSLDGKPGVDFIYEILNKYENFEETENSGQLRSDIKKVIQLYDMCSSKGIPKEYATGMILMYLELCKGYKVLDEQ